MHDLRISVEDVHSIVIRLLEMCQNWHTFLVLSFGVRAITLRGVVKALEKYLHLPARIALCVIQVRAARVTLQCDRNELSNILKSQSPGPL